MSDFFSSLKASKVSCEAKNAFCFDGKTLFVCLGVRDFEAEHEATALVAVDITGDQVQCTVVETFTDGPIDYYALSADDHTLLLIGGTIHRIRGEVATSLPSVCDPYLRKLSDAGKGRLAMIGDEGELHVIETNNQVRKLDTHTNEDIYAIHVAQDDTISIGGDAGTVVQGKPKNLEKIHVPFSTRVSAIYCNNKNDLLIASIEGEAFRIRDRELFSISGGYDEFYSICEFKGAEYWGDNDYGILERKGDELVPAYETEFAFNMNSSREYLTINAGVAIYVTDGHNWRQFEITKKAKSLVREVPLDFDLQ